MATILHGVSGFTALDLRGRLRQSFDRILAWREGRRERMRILREMSRFEDRDLRDLGLSRFDIEAIASGRFKR